MAGTLCPPQLRSRSALGLRLPVEFLLTLSAQDSSRTGERRLPRPLQLPENSSKRIQSQLLLTAGLCRQLGLHHPGSLGDYFSAQPILLRMLGASLNPCPLPHPQTPRESVRMPSTPLQGGGGDGPGAAARPRVGKRLSAHSSLFAFLPKWSLDRSHIQRSTTGPRDDSKLGLRRTKRICCPSSFRTEVIFFVFFFSPLTPSSLKN